MSDVKFQSIETKYKGYKFRSRLEARWAVFFDTLEIKWEYEKEGYKLQNGRWYLPDFWLTDFEVHVEVKGVIDQSVGFDILEAVDWGGIGGNGLILLGKIPNHRVDLEEEYLLLSHDFFHNEKNVIRTDLVFGKNNIYPIEYDDCLQENYHVYDTSTGRPYNCVNNHSWCERGDEAPFSPFRSVFDIGNEPFSYYNNGMFEISDIRKYTYFAYDKARQARFEHGECG